MRKSSVLTSELKNLNQDISEFENNYKKIADVTCSSDCYCHKQGNHKITNSLYHKKCITMKKISKATVQKCDIAQPRRKCHERVEVINFNKARVEVSVKKPQKDVKNQLPTKYDVQVIKPVVKFVDKGTDPITILEAKPYVKKSWSDILTHHSKSNIQQPTNEHEGNFKSVLKSRAPSNQQSSSVSSPISSYKMPPKVVLKDCGTQSLDEITKGDLIPVCLPRIPTDSISNPLISLQALVKELKDFKRGISSQKDYGIICSIISEMEIALNSLAQNGKSSQCPSNKISESTYSEIKENIGKSSIKNERLYKNVEQTCTQLKIACKQLEDTCEKLRHEKDHVTEKFFEKSIEVENCLKREIDYQSKLSQASKEASSMSIQLSQYTRSMEELTVHVHKLQEENRALERAEEDKVRLSAKLMEASRENDKLNAEIQLLTLEREKNKVLLDIKEKELDKLRKQLVTIGGLVSERIKDNNVMGGDTVLSNSLEISIPNLTLSETRGQDIASSSPEGSMSSPSKSWKAMSCIASSTNQSHHQQFMATLGVPSRKKSEDSKRNRKGETPPLESIKHLKNELRELFAQMKKQTEVSEALLIPELKVGSDSTLWSSITDSSDGYISITDVDYSGRDS